MSNETMGFDNNQSLEKQKDEDGDGLQAPYYVDDSEDPSTKKARLEGPGIVLLENEHGDSSNTKGMPDSHVDDLQRTQNDGLSFNSGVAEVHGNVNAEIGRSAGKPTLSETLTHVQSSVEGMHSQSVSLKHSTLAPSNILGQDQNISISSDAASGTCRNSAADGTLSKQCCEFPEALHDHLDDKAAYESYAEAPHASYSKVLFNGSMHGVSQEHTLLGSVVCGEIPESTTASRLSGWHAGQTGPNPQMASMHVGRPPVEALHANGSSGRYTQEREIPHFPFVDPPASVVGSKGEPAQFACKDAFELSNRVLNYEVSNNDGATYVHEKSSTYNQPGGEDLKVNIEHTTFSNQAPSFAAKDGSVFSGSSYYASQSRMKNWALVLRFGSAIFSLIAFSIIISTTEKRVAAGSTFYVKFSDYQAYNYAAALNLLTFLYSSGQLIFLAKPRTSRILSSPLKWGVSVYLCDQMLAFFMVSASSSAATASELSWHGLHNIWPPACSTWRLSLFCSRADAAVAMSFTSCLFTILSTFCSGYHLANLLAE